MAIQAQLYSDNTGVSLCCPQDLIMDNCSFNESLFSHQQKQQQRHYIQQQMNQNMSFGNLFVPTTVSNVGNSVENGFACHMELHRRELDQYLRLQNEKLIIVLQEYRMHQHGMMIKKIESEASNLLRQKEAEISQVAKRTMELEEFLAKLEMEKLQWQRVAQENESLVAYLNTTLEELRENCYSNNEAEDAESCYGDVDMEENVGKAITGESRGLVLVDKGEQSTRKMMDVCKSCNYWNSCMLFLPCRHLCLCKKCEAVLDCCPVCGTVKKNSIEALIF